MTAAKKIEQKVQEAPHVPSPRVFHINKAARDHVRQGRHISQRAQARRYGVVCQRTGDLVGPRTFKANELDRAREIRDQVEPGERLIYDAETDGEADWVRRRRWDLDLSCS